MARADGASAGRRAVRAASGAIARPSSRSRHARPPEEGRKIVLCPQIPRDPGTGTRTGTDNGGNREAATGNRGGALITFTTA